MKSNAAIQSASAHGGELVNLLVSPDRSADLRKQSRDLVSWELDPRQVCDLELLLNGSFSPLQGFLTRSDYECVCEKMRLRNGVLWPIPVCLAVTDEFAR